MQKVKIITDSTCDLPKYVISDLGISVVPLKVFMNDEVFISDVNLTSKEFYRKMPDLNNTPSTNPPSSTKFYTSYEDAMDEADNIISIHISKKMSETLKNAEQARNMLPHKDIRLYDSKTTGASLGLIVLAAAKAAKNNKSINEISNLVEKLIKNVRVIGIPSTLKYLVKGGRIGRARGLVGRLFGMIPILTVSEGETASLDTIQGKENAMDWMIKFLETEGLNSKSKIALTHGNSKSLADVFLNKVIKAFNCQPQFTGLVGPVVGSHLGPGSLFFSYIKES